MVDWDTLRDDLRVFMKDKEVEGLILEGHKALYIEEHGFSADLKIKIWADQKTRKINLIKRGNPVEDILSFHQIYSFTPKYDLVLNNSLESRITGSSSLNLKPYIVKNLSEKFFQAMYFPDSVEQIGDDEVPPKGSILMTHREHVPEMEKIDIEMPVYFLQIKD